MTLLPSKTFTEDRARPAACAIARLPFIPPAYTSSNYTIALYKLGMPTQLQLHLSVVSLALGKIFHFLTSLDVGYLSSAIEPTHGKGGTVSRSRAGKYGFGSKVSNNSGLHQQRSKAKSFSDQDSSKNLVPSNYGVVTAEVEGVPMGKVNGNVSQQASRNSESGRRPAGNEIVVTRQYEIRTESAQKKGQRMQEEEDEEYDGV